MCLQNFYASLCVCACAGGSAGDGARAPHRPDQARASLPPRMPRLSGGANGAGGEGEGGLCPRAFRPSGVLIIQPEEEAYHMI